MEIEFCPTQDMIADFYTKPLQGKSYYKMRQYIMGHDTMLVEERVSGSNEMATEHSTKVTGSRNKNRTSKDHIYKVSNNFNYRSDQSRWIVIEGKQS